MKTEYERWRDELNGKRAPWWEPWLLIGTFGFLVGLAIGLTLAVQRGLL